MPPAEDPFQPLQSYLSDLRSWCDEELRRQQSDFTPEQPLYHYTNTIGLRGILQSGAMWLTDYRHLNDPSELIHGIECAGEVVRLISTGENHLARAFLDTIIQLLSDSPTSGSLEFFISSFSRARDDLGQWRAYADNGRGFAIGLAPRLFRNHAPVPDRPSDFLATVKYGGEETCRAHQLAIDHALGLFLTAAETHVREISHPAIGPSFMGDMVRELIATVLLWNCLTSKHAAYRHEEEVRLIIPGTRKKLLPHIKTRFRGSEIVPYIPLAMGVGAEDTIAEIVIGPAAHPDAQRGLETMLHELGVSDKIPISRSDIPYRAL